MGLLATKQNADEIAGAVLRAWLAGHRVLVTAQRDDWESLTFASALGATIVEPPADWTEAKEPRDRLADVARSEGHPGLLYQTDPSERIDFQATTEDLAATNEFVIEARRRALVEQEPPIIVGIPAYNEAATIGPVVEAALRYADEVLVVDDGSEDDTAQRAEEAGASVVQHDTNRGYGAALKTVFDQADRYQADHLVVLDGDGQHDVTDVEKLVRAQRATDAEVVIGSRFGDGAETTIPLYRRFGLGVVNVLTNLSLGVVRAESRVRDTQSGFRAYNRRAIESLADDDAINDRMSASTDILYHAHSNGYDVEEVPTTIDYGIEDGSSRHPLQHGIVLVMNIVRTIERDRPITMLGLPGVVCTLLGFGFGYWTFSNYLATGSFPTGIALLSSILTTIGILTSFTAIILHSLAVYQE